MHCNYLRNICRKLAVCAKFKQPTIRYQAFEKSLYGFQEKVIASCCVEVWKGHIFKCFESACRTGKVVTGPYILTRKKEKTKHGLAFFKLCTWTFNFKHDFMCMHINLLALSAVSSFPFLQTFQIFCFMILQRVLCVCVCVFELIWLKQCSFTFSDEFFLGIM